MSVPRPPIAVVLAGAALAACAAPVLHATTTNEPAPVVMPHPGPHARASAASAAAANEACERCHVAAATAWRASLHAHAWDDAIFQRSFAEEPSAFCRDCHAPETTSPALGVACVTCHDPAGTGAVLAAPVPAPAPGERRPSAPHRVLRDAAFADDRACAGCHEFAFPDAAARGHDDLRMQRTLAEHRASRFAARSCASCHMPKLASGGRGHSFAVASDPPMLRRALVARAARHEERVEIELAPGEVGHAFPTGDLFRRLVVIAEVVGDDYQLVVHRERPLARHFRFELGPRGTKVQREIADDRVQGGPRRVDLELGALARGREIVWRVEWQRIQTMHGDNAVIAATVVVAEGRLPPAREATR